MLRSVEKVITQRDNFVLDALFYFEQCIDLNILMICSVLGFQLLRQQESFAVISVFFAVSLGKMSYNSLI